MIFILESKSPTKPFLKGLFSCLIPNCFPLLSHPFTWGTLPFTFSITSAKNPTSLRFFFFHKPFPDNLDLLYTFPLWTHPAMTAPVALLFCASHSTSTIHCTWVGAKGHHLSFLRLLQHLVLLPCLLWESSISMFLVNLIHQVSGT